MDTPFRTIVTAAGRGERLGADKALVELGDFTAVERVVAAHTDAGIDDVVIVRRPGAPPLPPLLSLGARVVVSDSPEMIDSVRAGLEGAPDGAWVIVHPIDYALATDAVAPLRARCKGSRGQIVLPLCAERPGHPIAFAAALAAEIDDARTVSLRDVVRRDAARVDAFALDDPWILRDIDTPEDLASARAWLARPWGWGSVTRVQRAHRSRRAFAPTQVPDVQLDWIVDSARRAATSSLMQPYAVVAVRAAARRAEIARLCNDQAHVRDAPVFLAICADLFKLERACARHGGALQDQSLEIFVEATIDAAILGQNIQLAAESEGLGACMIGAAREHPVALARVLDLPPRVFVAFGMVLGFAADDPLPRSRMPLGAVLHHERYDRARADGDLDQADEAMRAWAHRTNAERGGYGGRPVDEKKGWAERMARLWGHADPAKGRANLAAELRQLGFGLRVDRADDP